MVKKWVLWLFLFSGIIVSGCRKTIDVQKPSINSMDDLHVASTFSWETLRVIHLSLEYNPADASIGTQARISLFLGNPDEDGRLLATGAVGYQYPFITMIRIPSYTLTVFTRLTTETGYSETAELAITDNMFHVFTGPGTKKTMPSGITGPDCSAGCDEVLTGSGTVTISEGKTYCIINAFSGSITLLSGTLRICGDFSGNLIMGHLANPCDLIVTSGGTASIGTLIMGNNCRMTVYESASLLLESVTMAAGAQVINYGTLTVNNNFLPNDRVWNSGQLTVQGQYNTNIHAGELYNSGTLTVSSDLNSNNKLTNDGTIICYGLINFDQGEVNNYCKIIGYQNIIFNGVDYTSNNGYLSSDLKIMITLGAIFNLLNHSMVSCRDFEMDKDVLGKGAMNVIKCTASGKITGTAFVTGSVEFLTPDGTLVAGNYPDNFRKNAVLHSLNEAQTYLPVTPCNPEGCGEAGAGDSDGDGIVNALDDYPNDPAKAFDNWAPCKSSFSSLAFEDLWPSKGDFDMNDAVVDYQFQIITNAENKIVEIRSKFYLRAAGAVLKNGFGFQFDEVSPASVREVTGSCLKHGYITQRSNGLEDLQEYAVVIVWDNADNVIHYAGSSSMFNTLKDYPAGYSDTVCITVRFSAPLSQETMGLPPFNPFLIKGMDRAVEIHLADYHPTSLANVAFFGTYDDDSDPASGRFYRTRNNIPWVLSISEKFNYTYEMIPILKGYHYFPNWCQSSGLQYSDWYWDLPGYRDPEKIYSLVVK